MKKIILLFYFLPIFGYVHAQLCWEQLGADIDGEAAGDFSGSSVSFSADGSRVAIGAYLNAGNGINSGHVRVYEFSGGSWTQLGADINGEALGDNSGRSVALSADGSRVAIGAPSNDGNGSVSGHVRVYDFIGGNWTQVGADIDGEAASNLSGWSVSFSSDGSRLAIGALANNDNGSFSGQVRVYQFSGGNWTQVGADINGEAVEDQFGSSVSLSSDGSRVAIGALFNDGNGINSGHVRVYDFIGGSWMQVGADIDGEAAGDNSGWSVSLSGDGSRLAIGAYLNAGNGINSGHVRVYDFIGGNWTQVGADIDGEAAEDQSGWSVSLSGDGSRIAIGALFNDGNGTNSGQLRVYQFSGGSWTQVGADINGEAANDNLGYSVSFSADGSRVATGAFFNDGNGNQSGHVRVYALGCCPDLTAQAPAAFITNSTCTDGGCLPTGGSISAPDNACPIGSTFHYSTDNGDSWSSTPPLYDAGAPQTILTRCNCNDDDAISSPTNSVTTAPEACADAADLFWQQLGMDIDGEANGDNSGHSVSFSADGSTLAIGAPFNDAGGNDRGQVRVYQNLGGVWTQVGADIDGEADFHNLGSSVSLSDDGSTLAIGAPGNNIGGTFRGQVEVYQNMGGVWTQVGADIDGEADDDLLGYSVSLSADGSTVAIGAIGNDAGGLESGQVRVYQNMGGVWTQVGADIDGEAAGDLSGYSVSLSADGSTVAVGAIGNDAGGMTRGQVRVYQNLGGVWTQVGADIDGEADSDQSGYSVSLSSDGSTVAIGAPGNDAGGNDRGQVRVYKNMGGVWTQVGADIDGEAEGDQSGSSVSLSTDGSTLAIGAIFNDGGGNNSGQVRVYKNMGGMWTQVGADIDGEADGDRSGWSVSLSADGSTLAIGAIFNDAGGNNSGQVRVYEIGCVQCTATLSGTATICAGSTANLVVSVTDGTGPYTVEFDNNGDLTADLTIPNYISGSNIEVTPGATTTYTLLSVTDNGNDEMICEVSGTATVTVNRLPTGTFTLSDAIICESDEAFLQFAAATGTPNYTITFGGGNINPGTTTQTVGNGNAFWTLNTTWYNEGINIYTITQIEDANGCITVLNEQLTLAVNNVDAGMITADQTTCSGGNPAAFTSTTDGTGFGTITYRWESSTTSCDAEFATIDGGTSATYDPTALNQTTYYRRITISTSGNVACEDTSNCVIVTVNQINPGEIGGSQTVCTTKDPVPFTSVTSATGSGMITYQWESSTTNCEDGFTPINGATAATFDAAQGQFPVTIYFRRRTISILNGVACDAVSNCITLTVLNVDCGQFPWSGN